MTSQAIHLHTACLADAYALWLWANDPQTRRAAFDRAEIPWPEHVEWLTRQLGSPHAIVLLGFGDDEQPVGSVRFDTPDGWTTARLSYVIAPESRGRRYGSRIVADGVDRIRLERPKLDIWADVRLENAASVRVFRGLGWIETTGMDECVRFQAKQP